MKVLLLGADGFIGRRVAARLAAANHALRVPTRQQLDVAALDPSRRWTGWPAATW